MKSVLPLTPIRPVGSTGARHVIRPQVPSACLSSPEPRNARVHSKKQVRQIAKSIEAFGFAAPVVVDQRLTIIAGHGRVEAAKQLKLSKIPVRVMSGLSDAQARALMLADNKVAENAGWDVSLLATELSDLTLVLPDLGLDVSITGFAPGEIDEILAMKEGDKPDPADAPPPPTKQVVTRRGDLWVCSEHRLLCGDARSADDVGRLMGSDRADMVFVDPPYNVKVTGHVGGRGATQHDEFAFASGEMSVAEFIDFLEQSLRRLVEYSVDGALHYVCMDWRHLLELLQASRALYSEHKNICVWDKRTPGQGSFYRSQHEMVCVFKVGTAAHINAVEQGRHGRNRSNLWSYAGVNAFGRDRMKDLAAHPTVKPVALVVDALRDASVKGDIVFDTFLGSGTTMLAAERVDRRCRGVEYEPKYCDEAIGRWEEFTRREAVLVDTGETFEEVAARRGAEDGAKARDADGERAPTIASATAEFAP